MGLPPLLPTLEIFYGVAEDKSMRDYMQARLELLVMALQFSTPPLNIFWRMLSASRVRQGLMPIFREASPTGAVMASIP